ncbi:MAG: hypothetical protein Q4D80_03190 [Pseudomonadota bacterium]|nr:hypothetical protein [Pseudomonadota bacterium]
MDLSTTELTELVCTRLSHDLIGSIGAISSSLELIEDENGQLDEDTKNILQTGADTLIARQKFFRIAFGTDTQKLPLPELEKLCNDYLKTIGSRANPIVLNLQRVSKELTKIVCICVMIAAELYIKGGEIVISASADNITVKAVSDFKLSASKISAYQKILNNENIEDNTSQFAQFYYLQALLGSDVPLRLSAAETEVELIIG